MASLLDLPSEILDKIYSFSLPFGTLVELLPAPRSQRLVRLFQPYEQDDSFDQPMRRTPTVPFAYGLFGTCRKTRSDTQAAFYASNTFVFNSSLTKPSVMRLQPNLPDLIRSVIIFECVQLAVKDGGSWIERVLGRLCCLTSCRGLESLKVLLSVDDCREQGAVQHYLEAWQAQLALHVPEIIFQVYHCRSHDAEQLCLDEDVHDRQLRLRNHFQQVTRVDPIRQQSALNYKTRSCARDHQYWQWKFNSGSGTWNVERYTYCAAGRVRVYTLTDHLQEYRQQATATDKAEAVAQLKIKGAKLANAQCHNLGCSRTCSRMPHDLRFSRPFWCRCESVIFCGQEYCSLTSSHSHVCVHPRPGPGTFTNFRRLGAAVPPSNVSSVVGDVSVQQQGGAWSNKTQVRVRCTAINILDCKGEDAEEDEDIGPHGRLDIMRGLN